MYVIASYMDESFDMGSKGVFAVGGIMARGVALFELERKWEALCERPDIGIAYFKASECERGAGEFSKFVKTARHPTEEEKQNLQSISHKFLALIPQQQFIITQGFGVVQKDFYEVIKDDRARAILGDTPYFLAYHLAMIQCAWAMKELEKLKMEDLQPWQKVNRDYISFVCDENARYTPMAHAAYKKLKEGNPRAAEFMATYSEADEKKVPKVQAADATIFEIRRALNLELGQWEGELRKQFSILADARKMFLIQHTAKAHLEHIVRTHEPGEPFKLDEIMDQVFHEDIRLKIYGDEKQR